MDALASQFARLDDSYRAALVHAEVASTVHRFDDARGHLARAALMGGPCEVIERHSLTIDQACGVELDAVLAARRRIARASGRLEDLVPLGAVLADLERFAEADAVYRQAFSSYDGRFAVPAGVGLLSARRAVGRTRAVPDPNRAALWYRRAIGYLPGYVKARVHWRRSTPARTNRRRGGATPAGASSRDPEVRWRLADVLIAQGRFEEARHSSTPHGLASMSFSGTPARLRGPCAEFYAGSGNDRRRRSSSRARMSRIVRHAVRSSRRMRSS
jgi:hypothetical protein